MGTKVKKAVTARPLESAFGRLSILGLASGLGLGLLPGAPGTFGSLLGLPLGYALLHLPTWLSAILLVVLFFPCCAIADRAGRHWGDMDASRIVIDEVLGQAIALLGLRHIVLAHGGDVGAVPFLYIVYGFALFRILDIVKPFPARSLDQQASGFGNVGDDVVAGLYAAVILRGVTMILERA